MESDLDFSCFGRRVVDTGNTDRMKRSLLISLLFFSVAVTFSQSDTTAFDKKTKNRFGIGIIPSASKNIYGVAIGPVGSEAICNRPYTKYSHGLNLQVPGQGFFMTFYLHKISLTKLFPNKIDDSLSSPDTLPPRAIHNGLLMAPLGTFTDQVNGVTVSLWMSMGNKMNGLSFNLLWSVYKQINGMSIGFVNNAASTNGIQIGIVNNSIQLNGIQIGLWNKNEKRSLPLINWNFRK